MVNHEALGAGFQQWLQLNWADNPNCCNPPRSPRCEPDARSTCLGFGSIDTYLACSRFGAAAVAGVGIEA